MRHVEAGLSYGQPLIVRLLGQGFFAVVGTGAIIYCHGIYKVLGFSFALVGYGCLLTEAVTLWLDYKPLSALAGRLRWWLRGLGWPTYDCEDCIGMHPPHGCYCAAYDCVGPCEGARAGHRTARRFYGLLFGSRKW